jgi:ribonuclease HII
MADPAPPDQIPPEPGPAPQDLVLTEPDSSPEGAAVVKPSAPTTRHWAPRGRHPGYTPRTSSGLAAYERALIRAGFAPVAGVDEAGRGACAGPLVVAAVMLRPDGRTMIPGLADSKELLPAAREEVYRLVVQAAFTWHVVVIPPKQIDRLGLHVCNVTGMRRALAGLRCRPGFALTDGFPVRGLDVPSLAMWKGDQVAACVAAASILAKVTRDRIMTDLDEAHPLYGFARHKGYCTPDHKEALMDHGPCPSHRFSYVNVIEAMRARAAAPSVPPQAPAADDEQPALATRAIGIG